MGNSEFVERVLSYRSTVNAWRNDFNSVQYKEADRLNEILFGKRFGRTRNCSCVSDFYLNLDFKFSKNKIIENMEKRFKVKPGKVIMSHGIDPVTEHSSDEQAIELLKKSPKFAKHFERIPENWEKIVKEHEPKSKDKKTDSKKQNEKKPLDKMTVAELEDFADSQVPKIEFPEGLKKDEKLEFILSSLKVESQDDEKKDEDLD